MKLFSILFSLCFLSFGLYAKDVVKAGDDVKPTSLILQSIDAQSNPNQSLINLRFNASIEKKDFHVEDHGNFFQLSFDNTLLASPGKFVEGNSPYVLKVGGFQGSESFAIIRFFVSEKAEFIKQAMNISSVGNRVVLSVDHAKLKSILGDKTDLPKEDKLVTKDFLQKTSGPDFFDANDSMVKFSIVSLFLFGLLILLTLSKKYFRRRLKGSKAQEGFQFKEIDRLVLSPRLKLSLIQIGEERIVLSVSQDSAQFLTKLSSHESFGERKLVPHKVGKDSSELDVEAKRLALKMLHKSQEKTNETFLSKLRESSSTENVVDKNKKELEESRVLMEKDALRNKRISYKIDDEGVHNTNASEKKEMDSKAARAMSDLTKMIRDKINSLPKV